MLSITSRRPDPQLEPAARWQSRTAPWMLLFMAVFLYVAQRKTGVGMTVLCCVEFAVIVFSFVKLLRQKTRERANQFTFSWMAASAFTQMVHLFFLR